MIKWYWYALRPKNNKKHYFEGFNEKLNYENFKKKNWNYQLKISFKSDNFYKSKIKFFRKHYKTEYVSYVSYFKKNFSKKKKFLSIGSGRGVAELKLIENGYDITLSDIDHPSGLSDLKKIFRKMKYIKFDIFKNKLSKKYDCIICFNLIYAFDKKKLNLFFKKSKNLLKKDGVLLISPGGSTQNILKIIYNNLFLPLETFFLYIFFLFTNKNLSFCKFHHGYIYSDKEIIKIANQNNCQLSKKVIRGDNYTEFERSKVISFLMKKSLFFKWFFGLLGNKIPFSNFFYLKKNN